MIPHVRRRCTGAALVLAVAALIACSDVTSEAPDAGAASNAASEPGVEGWTSAQLSLLESISLDALPAPPAQPSNRVADDPHTPVIPLGGRLLQFRHRLAAAHLAAKEMALALPRNYCSVG